jgi:hypothetical protein
MSQISPDESAPVAPPLPPTHLSARRDDVVDGLRRGAVFGLVAAAVGLPIIHFTRRGDPAASASPSRPLSAARRLADFGAVTPSPDARHVANWVADSRDNHAIGFVIVDKKFAAVHVFDGEARLVGSTPVLLGYAAGDHSVAGVGQKKIEDIRPEERTTPAGRFIAQRGVNHTGEDVVWIDYEAAVSMHRVRATNPAERRLERLATPGIEDNRISWGCINVPVAFYDEHISPLFARYRAAVYVLPEVLPVREVFASYDVPDHG